MNLKPYILATLALLIVGPALADEPDTGQITQMMDEAAANLTTYTYTRVAYASITYDNETVQAEFQATKETAGGVNLTAKEGWWTSILQISDRDEDLRWNGYLVNGSEYWEEDGNWTQFISVDPESVLEDYNELPGQVNLINISEMQLSGTKTLEGEECYVLSGIPGEPIYQRIIGIQLLAAYFPSPFTMPEELSEEGEGVNLSSIIDNSSMSLTAWVSKETGLLMRLDINSSLLITPEVLGISSPEFQIDSTIAESTSYSQFGSPMVVQLPLQAIEGQDFRTQGTDWRWTVFGLIMP